MKIQPTSRRQGFSLIDALIAVVIVALLMDLLLIAVQESREAARAILCVNQLRQIGLAASAYEVHSRSLPPGKMETIQRPGTRNPWGWGFIVSLLPFMEESLRVSEVRIEPSYCPDIMLALHNAGKPNPYSSSLTGMACPSDSHAGRPLLVAPGQGLPNPNPVRMGLIYTGSYLGVNGTDFIPGSCLEQIEIRDGNGLMFSNRAIRVREIRDGLSKTLLIGERGVPSDHLFGWMVCATGRCDPYISTSLGLRPGWDSASDAPPEPYQVLRRFWSWHPSGVQFAFADGSARRFDYGLDHWTFQEMATRNGPAPRSFDPRRREWSSRLR